MNVLFVSQRFPYPQAGHAGGVSIFHTIRSLSERHRIHLVSYIFPEELKHLPEVEPFCASIDTVLRRRTRRGKIHRLFLLMTSNPFVPRLDRKREMAQKIRRVCERERFDIAQIEYAEMGQFISQVKAGATLLDEIDVAMVPLHRRFQTAHSYPMRLYWLLKWFKMRYYETRVCRRFDGVLTRSQKDKDYLLGQIPHLRVSVLPPYIDLPSGTERTNTIAEECSILFLGAMWRDLNAGAVVYFHDQILPLIRKDFPQAKLYIVGASPTLGVRALASEKVIVTGYVHDTSSYYSKCRVFVAPMMIGGAIITKILQAMAAGRPVVTTAIGNEGIGAKHGKEILVADTRHEFAAHVIHLLKDPHLWRRIASGGQNFIQREYDWESAIAKLEETYAELLSAKGMARYRS